MIRYMIKVATRFAQRYLPRIYWVSCPKYLSHSAIVLFPYRPNLLCCGLVGILEFRRKSKPLKAEQIVAKIQELVEKLGSQSPQSDEFSLSWVHQQTELLRELKQMVQQSKRAEVFYDLMQGGAICAGFLKQAQNLKSLLEREERLVEKEGIKIPSSLLELMNNNLVALKDIIWSIENEVGANLDKVKGLLGQSSDSSPSPQLIQEFRKINFILNNLDRLEIRGRDSAGISVMITFPDQVALEEFLNKLKAQGLEDQFEQRTKIRDLLSGHIACRPPTMIFTFKVAAEIGKLGDNVAFLRRTITQDPIFHLALQERGIFTNIIAHTRWASVGMISEENCHPVNNASYLIEGQPGGGEIKRHEVISDFISPHYQRPVGSLQAVLNGDIDNYVHLRACWERENPNRCLSERITTDTKIIPLQVESYLRKGYDLAESFRRAVNDFEGSHAIALQSELEPGRIFLALRGSGQSIFVGIGEEGYFPASEIYGFVEETSRFIKMDGERERIAGEPKTQGQIFILDADTSGHLDGIVAMGYDGFPLALSDKAIQSTEITTRDIDRRGFFHYFLKEISESPQSVQKTIRGKADLVLVGGGDSGESPRQVVFNLGEEIIPSRIEQALRERLIKHIYLVGQGTAGIAASGIAMLLREYLSNSGIHIAEQKASELSGFCLDGRMDNTLVIAVTQSGTTTDTNKAVDMAKEAGAYTLAIVNRRDSDITYKVDGVFYTSDGRDIEMSVASTKAFYSQIVAGYLLGLRFAQIMGLRPDEYLIQEVKQLKRLPRLMSQVLQEKQDQIAASAKKWALSKRHWAVVGSGPNKVAADEIRIKLSELCYKTLPADVVEDRKHIDLSAEPLVLVCAAGSREVVLGDIIKDVAIFKAHKATTIVIANEGEKRFQGCADSLIEIPRTSERLSPILNTLVGHLWGYYAALNIDEEANFLRTSRQMINQKIVELESAGRNPLEIIFDLNFQNLASEAAFLLHQKNSAGVFNAAMKPNTIANLILLLKYAAGKLPITDLDRDFQLEGGISCCLNLLQKALDQAINELSRPIDAIKHQAKTVTVGTSRLPELLTGHIFETIRQIGLPIEKFSPPNLATLRRLQPVIKTIHGYTLYEVNQLDYLGRPTENSTIRIIGRGGISLNLASRVEKDSRLRGNKRSIVTNNTVFIGLGKSDQAQLLIIPAQGESVHQKIVLLFHIGFDEDVSLETKVAALGSKYEDLIDALAELDIPWQDEFLASFSTAELFLKSDDALIEAICSRLGRSNS
ncbi:MAG: SIS domain-containing protein [bacterium]|nr:SIS domain-containing protein [bacterium]